MSTVPVSLWRSADPRAWGTRLWHWTLPAYGLISALLLFAALTLATLGPALWNGDRLLSGERQDLALQFIHWRKFGFDQLRAGHLALWNPHIFCGTPFLGGFQSALLYPPNWLYMVLPLRVAVNVGIALHVFLAAFGMYLWTRQRGSHPCAAMFAGVLFMFSGPYFPHIYAGHLPNLCTMVWGPFIFLSIDGWLQRRTAGWLLLGAASVALQILAGHPQYVFYTGVAAGLYCAVRLAATPGRARAFAGLAVIAVAGVALSAAQLFEGLHAAGESVRNHGTPSEFAAVFSFPPENLLTLLTPNLFGDLTTHDYWGRWYLWEMSAFFGISGMVLAVYALVKAPRFAAWSCTGVAACLLVLSLGVYTPLFDFLYHHAPGFARFRGWSKFDFPAVLLMIVVAAAGFDHLLRTGIAGSRLLVATLAAGIVVAVAAIWAGWTAREGVTGAPEPWHGWLRALRDTGNVYMASDQVDDPGFVREAARQAASQLALAAGTLLALAAILAVARRHPRALYGTLGLAIVEMLLYAHSTLATFRLRDVFAKPDARFLSAHAGNGFRVFNEVNHNLAMGTGTHDLWGYDPGVLRRYAEWMAVAEGRQPDEASEVIPFTRFPPQFASLLRCRYILPELPETPASPGEKPPVIAREYTSVPVAPRLRLVGRCQVIGTRDDALAAVFNPAFDPAREVILETPPVPAPSGAPSAGVARIVGGTTDALTIEADLTGAAILLVTDTYSDGWKARSLLPSSQETSTQTHYDVIPADYCLRAVPLACGHHRILLEYRPTAFVVGKWVSLTALGLYLAGLATWCARPAWLGGWPARRASAPPTAKQGSSPPAPAG